MRIAIIPARGGSTRIPRKNIKLFHGRPIIGYAIETAMASGLFDRIHVSSEDSEILNIATEYGAIPYQRPDSHADNNVGTQEVTRQAMEAMYPGQNNWVCCIYPCTPLLWPSDIAIGMSLLGNGFSMAVGREPLRDVGWLYWGLQERFRIRQPLIGDTTRLHVIDEERAIDINTMEDWHRAEQVYAELHNIGVKPA
ncbi:NeuA CMP-N-acetylneuraminic acid synthetase [uncultured Caudovirales phage]|uniref:NeuA CMP-N-acetylneuraminic acid synthetase n=1 Tax=uncultured Caudovirales phage TaxID=2100421 RepID=A0A6J5T8L3_9CAUD|nr:NeuA CMP-N-acetylneuraminic acid synthetase [uncultured Caudovirales phage]